MDCFIYRKTKIVYFNSFGVEHVSVPCIFSSVSVAAAPAGIAGAAFALFFPVTTEISKKLLSITRSKKKKHDKILTLAKSKLKSVETLVS